MLSFKTRDQVGATVLTRYEPNIRAKAVKITVISFTPSHSTTAADTEHFVIKKRKIKEQEEEEMKTKINSNRRT